MGRADFHTHTFHSDGILSPNALFIKAKERGISFISITDHDTIEHIPREIEIAKSQSIDFVWGCEVSAYQEGKDYHIVALNFDYESQKFKHHFENYAKERLRRAEVIANNFTALGIKITMEDILKEANNAPIARPHIARAVVKAGYAKNIREVFTKYLNDRGSANEPKINLSVKFVVDLIHAANGVAILAHPSNFFTIDELENVVKDGIDGIEVFHPLHSSDMTRYYQDFARAHNLLVSGGSDFHNPDTDEKNFGKYSIDLETAEKIIEYSKTPRKTSFFKQIFPKLFSFL
jgi:predicted metal-dependent phosphoesterase TrpH